MAASNAFIVQMLPLCLQRSRVQVHGRNGKALAHLLVEPVHFLKRDFELARALLKCVDALLVCHALLRELLPLLGDLRPLRLDALLPVGYSGVEIFFARCGVRLGT